MCNVKPPIKPIVRSRRSLYGFFLLYISTHIITYFIVFPCISLYHSFFPCLNYSFCLDCDVEVLAILYVCFIATTMTFMMISWLKEPGYIPKGNNKKQFLVKNFFSNILERKCYRNCWWNMKLLRYARNARFLSLYDQDIVKFAINAWRFLIIIARGSIIVWEETITNISFCSWSSYGLRFYSGLSSLDSIYWIKMFIFFIFGNTLNTTFFL